MFFLSDAQGYYGAKYHELTIQEIESFWQRWGFWLLDRIQ